MFQVGDVVRIRSWEDMEEEFGLTSNHYIKCDGIFMLGMRHLCGATGKIQRLEYRAYSGGYKVYFVGDLVEGKNGDSISVKDWIITKDMIELVDRAELMTEFDSSSFGDLLAGF